MLSFTPASVSASTMSRASGGYQADRSSLAITSVPPDRTQPAPAQPRAGSVGAGQAVLDIGPVWLHAQRGERVALGGQVLGIGRAAGVSDEHPGR